MLSSRSGRVGEIRMGLGRILLQLQVLENGKGRMQGLRIAITGAFVEVLAAAEAESFAIFTAP